MAHSTVHVFDVTLSDVDRGVYLPDLSLKVARHPSETVEYMVTRVLAFVLEHEEGISFTTGLSTAEEPAIWVRDLTGALRAWIEVGTPDADRLHKASKATDRVVVYCHKDTPNYLRSLAGRRVHAPDRVSIVEVDRGLVTLVASKVEKRTAIDLTHVAEQLYVDVGGTSYGAPLQRHAWPG